MDSDDDDVPNRNSRQFSCAEIDWEIKNYFIKTCLESFEICSPEFIIHRPFPTRWRFKLRTDSFQDNIKVGYIYLERLKCENGPDHVHVFWKASLTTNKLELFDSKLTFGETGSYSTQIRNFHLFKAGIESNSDLQLPTSIHLKFEILIKSKNYLDTFIGSRALQLTDMAEHISIPLDVDNYQDISILVKQANFPCHKALLSAVNKFLDEAIDSDILGELAQSFPCEKTIRKLLRYFYSGNLDHVLKYPSLSVDQEIRRFRMKEAEEYYLKDAIHLQTSLEAAASFHFKWVIMDARNMVTDNFIESPKFSKRNFAFTFQLNLVGAMEEGKFVPRIVLLVEEGMPNEVFLVYDFMDTNNCVFNRRIYKWNRGDQKRIGCHFFVDPSRNVDVSKWSIECQMYFAPHRTEQTIHLFRQSMDTEFDYENHYALQTHRLEKLYNMPKYTDLVILCEGRVFRVHKFVLNVRSTLLKSAIDKLKFKNGNRALGFKMNDFDPYVLHLVLQYIYSSNLKDFSRVYEVYLAAKLLKIQSLIEVCLQHIEYDIEFANPVEVLLKSIEFSIPQIEAKAVKYIRENVSNIQMQDSDWEKLKTERVSLYVELKKLRSGSVYESESD